MIIATGQPEQHPTPLPLDASTHPGVAPVGAIASNDMVQGGVADTVGMFASQAAAGEAQAAAAMSSGMAADGARRQHYAADIAPLGTTYGLQMDIPPVPEDADASATPPAGGYLWGSGEGDQPGRGD